MTVNDRFSVNGKARGNKTDNSLPDRQRQASDAVAGIMDQINELLGEAEKLLKAFQPTASASIDISPDDRDDCGEWQPRAEIGFIKCEDVSRPPGIWRLCHRSYDESVVSGDRSSDTGWRPLTDCNRWLRVRLVSDFPTLLPQLQEAIVKTTEDFIPAANNAKAALRQALAALKESLSHT